MSTDQSGMAGTDPEDEAKTSDSPTLAQGAVFAQNVGTQHLHSAPHRQAAEYAPRSRDGDMLQQFMEQMQQNFQKMQAQMQAQMQQQMAQLQQLQVQQRDTSSLARPVVSPLRASSPTGEYSASAAIPLPPPGERRRNDPRRQSFGNPIHEATPGLVTPGPTSDKRTRFVGLDGENDETDDPEGLPVYSKRMREIRKAITSIIKPYHGTTTKDVYTVIDWVEKVDTEFSIQMGEVQEGRLDIVRSLLAGTALKWMNRRVLELNEQLKKGEISGPVEWSSLRQLFIDAHLGINTAETFKAELRSLRLGSELCPTPVELNKQFDHLAELAYPDRRADGMASVMGDEYKKIIAASKLWLYKSVALNQVPTTIDEWKKAVANRWAADKDVEATIAQLPRSGTDGASRGRGSGRGGVAGRGSGRGASTAQAASMHSDDGLEGEADTEEGVDREQLSAAAANGAPNHQGGRGGRGGRGRGGRGRGGSGQSAAPRKETRTCFRCNEVGHIAWECPNKAADVSTQQQSNE